MPRRRYQVEKIELDKELEVRLHCGSWLFPVENEPSEAELQRLWNLHRKRVLAAYILEHPGRRPWAWWMWDAPQDQRRRIGGLGTGLSERPDGEHPLSFGRPNAYDDDYSNEDPPRYESERDYLARHGLLTKAEQ